MERRSFIKLGLALTLTLSGSLAHSALIQPPPDRRLGYGWIQIIDMDWQPVDNRPITPPIPYVRIRCIPSSYTQIPQAPYYGEESGIVVGGLERVVASSTLAPDPGTSDYLDKSWSFDTAYEYRRGFVEFAIVYNATTEAYELITHPGYFYVPATFKKIVLAENQTVDSRLDMRFSDVHYQDFNFKDGAYRGGLYAGFNGDGARVGRSYMKFGVSSGDVLWPVGYLYAFKTRLTKTGTTSIKARKTATAWNKETLVWTNAPAPQADGYPSEYVEWSSTAPVSEWLRFRAAKDIETATGNSLSLSLLAEEETSTPWAYFARKEWINQGETAAIHPPYLLYAVGGQGAGEYTDPAGGGAGNGGGGNGGGGYGGGGYGGPPGGGGYGGPPGGYGGYSSNKLTPAPPAKKKAPAKSSKRAAK